MAYAALTLASLTLALVSASSGDTKGQIVFLQLPIALPLAGLQALGAQDGLQGLSLLQVYALLGLPSLAAIYGLGWTYARAIRALRAAWRRHVQRA